MKLILITCLLIVIVLQIKSIPLSNQLMDLQYDINNVIEAAKKNLWALKQQQKPLWKFTTQFGSMFLSEYYFFIQALNMTGELSKIKSKLSIQKLRDQLVSSQLPDGSWYQVTDLNRKQGSLDATIMNYWFLKDINTPQSSQTLKKARKFVLDMGGIEYSQISTKLTLALFGQYQWHLIPYLPFFVFRNQHIFSYFYIKDVVSSWAYPSLISLTYLRYFKTIFPVSRVCLSELRTSRSTYCEETNKKIKNGQLFTKKNVTEEDSSVNKIIEQMINLRGKKGSFAGNTKSTMLSLCILKHYGIQYGKNTDFYAYYLANVQQSVIFIQNMYFNQKISQSVIQDTTYLDTLFTLNSLIEAGQDSQKIHEAMLYLINNKVDLNGGISVGIDLQPNIDASSILLSIYAKMKNHFLKIGNHQLFQFYNKQINRTATWILEHQNEDGGYGAQQKGKCGSQHTFINLLFYSNGFDKSFQIFDSSCVEITGHVLQGLGQSDLYQQQIILEKILTSIKYIEKSQKQQLWEGRWGINHIYATSAVLSALKKIGFNLQQKWVLKTIQKLKTLQNQDGGFGESSNSYRIGKFVQGVSTVSMTAWGLLALISAQNIINVEQNINRAVQYLIYQFRINQNRFIDKSVVGTWKRNFLYSQPKSFASTYPLLALSRVKKLIENSKNSSFQKVKNVVALAYAKTKIGEKDL